jgi:hypothetical protein
MDESILTDQKATFTPGPWQVLQGGDERDFIVAEASGNTICEPNVGCFDFSDVDPAVRFIHLAEAKANADLIAAAPTMLAALKQCRSELHRNLQRERDVTQRGWLKVAKDAADAAIAKAEGR